MPSRAGSVEPTGPVEPHDDGSNCTMRSEPKRLRSRTNCSSSAAGHERDDDDQRAARRRSGQAVDRRGGSWPRWSPATLARCSRIDSTCAWPAANPESPPSVDTSRTRSWRRALAVTMLAAAEMTSSSRLDGVGRRAHVEQHRGATLPRQFVLAHHQLVVTRRRRPVHAAQVVAHHVLAQGVEVLTVAAERVGVFGTGHRVVAGGLWHRRDVVDVRDTR